MKLALERPKLISLAAGFTNNDTLPIEETQAIIRDILSDTKGARPSLQYGTTIGLPSLRSQILTRLQIQDQSNPYQPTVNDCVITNGSQQLLYLVSQVLCDPGDIVLVEDPTYFVYLGVIQELGINAHGFDGLSRLKAVLQRLKAKRTLHRVKMLYAVTYFQNPTGRTWSLEMKREALQILKHYERAAGHPIYIVEDAAYRDLRFAGPETGSFKSIDHSNHRVIYANTLTKPFATGMKVGYGILPKNLMRPILRIKSNQDFGTSNFLQNILSRALKTGLYEEHLQLIGDNYRKKCTVMTSALERSLRTAVHFNNPQGGLYIWVQLSPNQKTGIRSKLFKKALNSGVLYVPGELCYCSDPSRRIPRNLMRLSFGSPSIPQIRKGIKLLAQSVLGETN